MSPAAFTGVLLAANERGTQSATALTPATQES
jgi:hypothetical protein